MSAEERDGSGEAEGEALMGRKLGLVVGGWNWE